MEVKLKQTSSAVYSCETKGLEFEYIAQNIVITAIISSQEKYSIFIWKLPK